MVAMPALVLIVPGSIETLSGGYGYDRRMVAGLRTLGWSVTVRELDASFPHPTSSALRHAAQVLAALPDGTIVVLDGLAFGAMPDPARAEAARLRLVALVHHPLAFETGLGAAEASRLRVQERRALAAARLVITTSRATAAALADYGVGPERIAVVEPGTERAPIARGSLDDATLQLLCVGAIVPRKGHETLLEALEQVPDLGWHLTCVGSADRDPDTAARLRTRVRAANLNGRVTLAGEVAVAALDAVYDSSDLFVLPSLHEGYGMAVAEGIARGLPVVATDTGAVVELLAGGAGLIVPPGDAGALARALRAVLTDADLRARLRQGALRVRDELPTWDAAAATLADALAKVTDGGPVQR
jgi:glycosyltransferase involved in cell wall biosynthesis